MVSTLERGTRWMKTAFLGRQRRRHVRAVHRILFNALLGFAVMVFIAFALIRPDANAGTST